MALLYQLAVIGTFGVLLTAFFYPSLPFISRHHTPMAMAIREIFVLARENPSGTTP